MFACIAIFHLFHLKIAAGSVPTTITNVRHNHREQGVEDDEPSFSQVVLMISNQQQSQQMQRQRERKEDREERYACYEEQRDEWPMQMQIHQETMQ